jgi:dsRNA-specific ribonuclease
MTGDINIRLKRIVNNHNLTEYCNSTRLTKYINNNWAQGDSVSSKTKLATFEAVVGAVYLDSGQNMGQVRTIMCTLGVGALE